MSSKDEKDKSPTDTASVTPVEPMWSLDVWLNENHTAETTNAKCSECKVPTPTIWLKITPTPLFQTDDMIMIVSKARRLTMCTQCGLVKTIT